MDREAVEIGASAAENSFLARNKAGEVILVPRDGTFQLDEDDDGDDPFGLVGLEEEEERQPLREVTPLPPSLRKRMEEQSAAENEEKP